MRENKTPFRVVVYPLIWVVISFIIGIPIGLLFAGIIPIWDDAISCGFLLGVIIACLLILPIIVYYSLNAIRDLYRGGVMTPRYFEMIDNGIRFRSDNGEFDKMFAWHEFSNMKYLPPLGVMRLIPKHEKVKSSKGGDFTFREYWITIKKDEYQKIITNMER